MARLASLLIGAAALSLTACDQIRMPGNDAPPASTPDNTETAQPSPSDTAATPSETGTETGIDTPEDVAVTEPDPTEVSAPVTDLAAINAAICGLPLRPLGNSLTLAEIADAQPTDDAMIGTATISGSAASLSNFPGLVKMEPRELLPGGAISSGHCSATRIATNWFITAAHCLDDDYDEVLLIASAENLQSPLAKRVQARASICHASYGGSGNNFINDIALVRVDEEATGALAGVPIANFGGTSKTLVPFNYSQVRMAGWGLTSFNGSLSNDLLTATLALTGAGPSAIGVESVDGAGPCVGDSGGPLFVSEEDGTQTVVGVLSVVEQNLETSEFCAGTYGARYTNLQGYQDWIMTVIAACESGTGLCGF